MFLRTYASSRVKRKSFYRKSELQTFLLIFGGGIGTPKWRLHTKLYKGAWNVSANNSGTVGHKDLRLAQILYILVFYNISFSWVLPLDGFQFCFLFFCSVTVKTMRVLNRGSQIPLSRLFFFWIPIPPHFFFYEIFCLVIEIDVI